MGRGKVRSYDSEFKKSAVQLTYEDGRSVRDVAESLGISKDTLYTWRNRYKQSGDLAFPGKGIEALSTDQKRIRALEKQLRDTQIERDILKKAVAIFSVPSK